jgi:hypothetical protein
MGWLTRIFAVTFFRILFSSQKICFSCPVFEMCENMFFFPSSHENDIHFMYDTPCRDAEESEAQINNQTMLKFIFDLFNTSTAEAFDHFKKIFKGDMGIEDNNNQQPTQVEIPYEKKTRLTLETLYLRSFLKTQQKKRYLKQLL